MYVTLLSEVAWVVIVSGSLLLFHDCLEENFVPSKYDTHLRNRVSGDVLYVFSYRV